MNWGDIDTIRDAFCGYDPAPARDDVAGRAREASRLGMRKLYERRRKAGLNARGKPLRAAQKTNLRFKLSWR